MIYNTLILLIVPKLLEIRQTQRHPFTFATFISQFLELKHSTFSSIAPHCVDLRYLLTFWFPFHIDMSRFWLFIFTNKSVKGFNSKFDKVFEEEEPDERDKE